MRTVGVRRRVALLAVLLLIAAPACSSDTPANTDQADSVNQPLNGRNPKGLVGAVEQSPATPKPSFVLTDTSGAAFDLAKATSGAVTLLYFGYTHCPDVCPTTMADIGAAYRSLAPDIAANIKVVFVTSDPERDTAPVLRAWLDHFGASFTGLTGTVAQVNSALDSMGLPPIVKEPTSDGDYTVGHVSVVYAFTGDDLAHVVFTDGVATDRIAHDMKLLVGGWPLAP